MDTSKIDVSKAGVYQADITITLKSTDSSSDKDVIKGSVNIAVIEKTDIDKKVESGFTVIEDDNKIAGSKADTSKSDSEKKDASETKEKGKADSEKKKTAKTESSSTEKKDTGKVNTTSTSSNKKQSSTGTTQGNTSNTSKPSGNNNGGTQSTNSSNSKPAHVHNWVEQTHVEHIAEVGHNEQYVVTEAYDTTETVDVYEPWECCNICGADITADIVGHMKPHALAGEGGSWHTEYYKTKTQTVHHDAVYGTRWVVDSPAYDKTVSDGYKCSGCGATK